MQLKFNNFYGRILIDLVTDCYNFIDNSKPVKINKKYPF